MEDLIRRSDAIKALRERWARTISYDGIGEDIGEECEVVIKAVPSADRPRGEWNFIGDNMFECTSCGETYSTRQFEMMRNRTTDPLFPKGCPHCGERMKGADDEL